MTAQSDAAWRHYREHESLPTADRHSFEAGWNAAAAAANEARRLERESDDDALHAVGARLSTVEWRLARIRTLVDGTERPTTEEGMRWVWEQLRTYFGEEPAGLVLTGDELERLDHVIVRGGFRAGDPGDVELAERIHEQLEARR